MTRARVDPLVGMLRLAIDLDEVEKAFKAPGFRGQFNMALLGAHDGAGHAPDEENFCGTVACLAGWLAIFGKHEFKGAAREEV